MRAVLVAALGACGFEPAAVTAGGDDVAVDAPGDGTHVFMDAPGTTPLGCIPPAWHVTHGDDFTTDLSQWHLDTNVSPPTLSWMIQSGALLGHSASSGTDAELVTPSPLGDSAVVVHMRAASLQSATGYRLGGPLVRAQAIDGANNLYYGCLLDQEARKLYLARYDTMTQVGSGQSWTHLQDATTPQATATLTVILCAQGAQLECDVPELGVTLAATDALYATGEPALRVMLADLAVDDFTVYEP